MKDCRSLEQKVTADVMEYVERAVPAEADLVKVLGQVIYAAKKMREEVRDGV